MNVGQLDEPEVPETPDELEPEFQEGGPNGQPPKLLAGKYKSADELEKGYGEAQSAMTKAQQRAAKITDQLRSYGVEVDEDGNVLTPQNHSGAGQTVEEDDPNTAFYTNPTEAVGRFYAQARAQEKLAESNKRRIIAQFKTDPMFAKVSDLFEAELASIDDRILANPAQCARIAEGVYNMVAGTYARKHASEASQNPAARATLLRELGVEEPAGTNDSTGVVATRRDQEMMKSFGLTKKQMEEVQADISKESEEG